MRHPPAEPSGHPEVLLATAEGCWELDEDAPLLTDALADRGIHARPAVWDDPGVDWERAGVVVVRSTWDYPLRRDEFLEWAAAVSEVTRLVNPVEVIGWNTDKAYLLDLARDGLPVVQTWLLPPGHDSRDAAARIREAAGGGGEPDRRAPERHVVVKPSVSAGSRDTARFAPDEVDGAVDLAARICAGGRTAMVQPYLDSVDSIGETGLVYFDGVLSHAFTKDALLTETGEHDRGVFAIESISPKHPDAGAARLGDAVVQAVEQRFGGPPGYLRVDMLVGTDGSPVLLELEATEPSWFLATDPAAAPRAAAMIERHLAAGTGRLRTNRGGTPTG